MEGYVRGYEQGFADAPEIDIHNVPFDANNGNLSGNFAAKDGAIAVCGEDEIFFLWEKNIYQMKGQVFTCQPNFSCASILSPSVTATSRILSNLTTDLEEYKKLYVRLDDGKKNPWTKPAKNIEKQ